MSEGSTTEFRDNWVTREETEYSHFTRGEPKNQIQLAFQNHWETWNKIFPELKNIGRVLEVGAGRGTLSMYFADSGWDATILDIVPEVVEHAKTQFDNYSLPVKTILADCMDMPIPDNSFDVVFSIGLLEHFSNPEEVLREQLRVLAPGGLLIGYVVPEPSSECVQFSYEWINDIIRSTREENGEKEGGHPKSDVFRSSHRATYYKKILSKLGCKATESSGTYPVPMISWSTDFPFTLLSQKAEDILVSKFRELLLARGDAGFETPWLCEEKYGQAFLVWGRKPEPS